MGSDEERGRGDGFFDRRQSVRNRGHGSKRFDTRSVIPEIGVAGGGFDYVLESVGGTSLEQEIAHVRPNGRIIRFGNSSGTKSTFDMFSFFGAENACVDTFFSYRAFDHDAIGENLSYLLDLTSRARLEVRSTLFGWREMEAAISKLEQRGTPGKVVLAIGQLK